MSSLILFFISIALSGVSPATKNYRVIGGTETEIQRYPSQVSIKVEGTHHCGGSILSKSFILTAAHCFYGGPEDPSIYTVTAGTAFLNSGGKTYDVQRIFMHPKYTTKYENDIAIVKIDGEIDFNENVKPANITNSKLPPAGTMGEVCGWGRTNAKEDVMSNQLMRLNIPIIDHKICMGLFKRPKYVVDDQMFCAGFMKGKRDSCLGDSGGPFFVKGVLYGIVSWGVGCGLEKKPGVYADIYKFRKYIRSKSGV